MIDLRLFQTVYQQWSDGQTNIAARWVDFVELVSRMSKVPQDEVARQLQKTNWFKWTREE